MSVRSTGLVAALPVLELVLWLASVTSVHAHLVSVEPAGNVVSSAPEHVRLTFDTPPDPLRSTVAVYTSAHERLEAGQPRVGRAERTTLVVDLPNMTPGVYTVVWHAADLANGPLAAGSFAFVFDPSRDSPRVAVQPQPQFALVAARSGDSPLACLCRDHDVRRLPRRSLSASGHRPPAAPRPIRRRQHPGAAHSTAAWCGCAAGGMMLFLPATVTQLVWEAGNAAKRPLAAAFDLNLLASYLGIPGVGTLWSIRLLLSAAAIGLLVPVAGLAGRGGWGHASKRLNVALGAVLGLCVAELLVRTLPAAPPSDLPRAAFRSALDWGHLLGASVWVGGLVGLRGTATLLRRAAALRPRGGRGRAAVFHRGAGVRRPDDPVGLVDGLDSRRHAGLALHDAVWPHTARQTGARVVLLVGLGALNLLWVLPRLKLRARRADPTHPTLVVAALRHFRWLVADREPRRCGHPPGRAVSVRFSPRSGCTGQERRREPDRHGWRHPGGVQTVGAAGGTGRLRGRAPAGTARRVTLTFLSPELEVPATEVLATTRGDGTYRASGVYTPIVGEWQVRVGLGLASDEHSVTFQLPVRAEPMPPPPNTAPPLEPTLWLFGAAQVLIVVVALFAAWRLSHWATARVQRN